MKYKVRREHADGGVTVSVPGLPDCQSQEADEEAALTTIREAIRQYLCAVDYLSEEPGYRIDRYLDDVSGGGLRKAR